MPQTFGSKRTPLLHPPGAPALPELSVYHSFHSFRMEPMFSQQRALSVAAVLFGCALLPLSSHAQLSFEAHEISQNQSTFNVIAHGDFNGDGREDLVLQGYANSGIIYELLCSDQNGTYQSPLMLPASVDAIGDFNHDGKLDFAS